MLAMDRNHYCPSPSAFNGAVTHQNRRSACHPRRKIETEADLPFGAVGEDPTSLESQRQRKNEVILREL